MDTSSEFFHNFCLQCPGTINIFALFPVIGLKQLPWQQRTKKSGERRKITVGKVKEETSWKG